ncbi:hypothetical protein [Desulfofundulus thermocisternus]|uniref:hypothetical protein n=1 Tax=Desulfofundulus thermocisternus TaxID=42471 RepID=UPI000480D94A|nr:hypothetical protein [Desulfofundulus thermocisternus]
MKPVGSLKGDRISPIGRNIADGVFHIAVPDRPVKFFREWPTRKLKEFYYLMGQVADELRWDADLVVTEQERMMLLDSAETAQKILIYIATELAARGVKVGKSGLLQ